MRYLLAVALVLQVSGASAAWPKACAATPGAEHACCLARQGGQARHVSNSCGCQMMPVPGGPTASVVSIAPEGGADRGTPLAAAKAAFTPALSLAANDQESSPPGSPGDALLSRLSGSGFRC